MNATFPNDGKCVSLWGTVCESVAAAVAPAARSALEVRVLGVQRSVTNRAYRIRSEPGAAVGRDDTGILQRVPHVPSVTPPDNAVADHNS